MDDIGKLIRYAGARESVDPERLAKARARVGEHWKGVVTEHARSRHQSTFPVFALAASVLVAIGVGFLMWQPTLVPLTPQLATVNKIIGDVRIDGMRAVPGQRVSSGSVVRTAADGRVALELDSGQSLRLDHESQLVAVSASRYGLELGSVYIDSGPGTATASLNIETAFGVATDIGTQFLVQVSTNQIIIGVREGLVKLNSVDVDRGRAYRQTLNQVPTLTDVSDNDLMWQWVDEIKPVFDAQGATLHQYLQWYARESGVALTWRDPMSEAKAMDSVLDASIENLSLDEGLQVVREIAPFEPVRSESELSVRVK